MFLTLLSEVLLCVVLFAFVYYILALQKNIHFKNTTSLVTNSQEINIVDALYFSLVTQSTVGYGSIVPVSMISKICVSFQVLSTLLFVVRWTTV